jgi:hypothetical protein
VDPALFFLDRLFFLLYIQDVPEHHESEKTSTKGGPGMTLLRVFIACTLVLVGTMISAPDAMGAEDFMVLRYGDGSTQRIRLERDSESIRQIEFVEGRRGPGREDRRGGYIVEDFMVLRYADGSTQRIRLERESGSIRQIEFVEGRRGPGREEWRGGGIRVIAGTYGGNCGAPFGNVTNHLAEVCDGKAICEYIIDFRVLGDPTPGCLKDYSAEWECGNDRERMGTSVGAGSTRIVLRCPVR